MADDPTTEGEEQAGEERAAEAPKKPAAKARKPAAEKAAREKAGKAKAKAHDAGDDSADAPPAESSPESKPAKKPAARKKVAAKVEAKAEEPEVEEPKAEQPGAEETTPEEPTPVAAKAPARRRGGEPGVRRAAVRAHARYVRTSARKARIVCPHIRGKSVAEARAILAFTPRDVARDWSKLLESAVANAENNHELLEDELVVREAYADEGPTIKRFQPRAKGRATPIRKRTSHLTITLIPTP